MRIVLGGEQFEAVTASHLVPSFKGIHFLLHYLLNVILGRNRKYSSKLHGQSPGLILSWLGLHLQNVPFSTWFLERPIPPQNDVMRH